MSVEMVETGRVSLAAEPYQHYLSMYVSSADRRGYSHTRKLPGNVCSR
jgi:hypothetical protein